ncbi:hypothetical protein [Streptomyces sp. SID1121]|uniref:hypothetical protein n=1 Tax=Streptomyces sp. SID1121 TaxID=3425888 RepID=UPI0040563A0A
MAWSVAPVHKKGEITILAVSAQHRRHYVGRALASTPSKRCGPSVPGSSRSAPEETSSTLRPELSMRRSDAYPSHSLSTSANSDTSRTGAPRRPSGFGSQLQPTFDTRPSAVTGNDHRV